MPLMRLKHGNAHGDSTAFGGGGAAAAAQRDDDDDKCVGWLFLCRSLALLRVLTLCCRHQSWSRFGDVISMTDGSRDVNDLFCTSEAAVQICNYTRQIVITMLSRTASMACARFGSRRVATAATLSSSVLRHARSTPTAAASAPAVGSLWTLPRSGTADNALRTFGTVREVATADDALRFSGYSAIDFTIPEDAPVYDAVQKFAAFNIGCLVTVDSAGTCCMLICARTIALSVLFHWLDLHWNM
jgi:hypothetical protein